MHNATVRTADEADAQRSSWTVRTTDEADAQRNTIVEVLQTRASVAVSVYMCPRSINMCPGIYKCAHVPWTYRCCKSARVSKLLATR